MFQNTVRDFALRIKLPFTTEAAMAKVFASEVAMAATTKAIQIHGGYGYTMDSAIQCYFHDAKITEIYEVRNNEAHHCTKPSSISFRRL